MYHSLQIDVAKPYGVILALPVCANTSGTSWKGFWSLALTYAPVPSAEKAEHISCLNFA